MKRVHITVIALSFAMFCVGCSTAWVSTLDSILRVAAPALVNILQIAAVAENQPMNSGLAVKINADTAAITALAADFAKASSGSAGGVCQELQAAVSTYSADQQLVLQVAQVSDPNTQQKITLLTDLVAGTVDAIMAVIPSCESATLSQAMSKPAYSISTFAADYNKILVTKTGNAEVDAVTPRLKLHQHSNIVRWISLGRLP